MTGSAHRFLIVLAIWCLFASALAAVLLHRRLLKRHIVVVEMVQSLCAVPIGGGLVGTFYSHAFSIPWYIYGVIIAIISFSLSSVILVYWPKR